MFAAFEGLIPKPISPEDCVFHTKTFQRMNKLRGKQDSIANLMITFAREESGCWTIITPEGVAKLCEVCTILGSFLILEIGGGNGLNAYLIEKYSRELGTPIMVTCTDAQIEDYSKGVLHHAVEKMTADEAVRAYPQMSAQHPRTRVCLLGCDKLSIALQTKGYERQKTGNLALLVRRRRRSASRCVTCRCRTVPALDKSRLQVQHRGCRA